LNLSFAKQAIDDFYNQFGHLYLRFFGEGEPTQEINKIKDILDYSKKFTNIKSELQTNGFFNENVCKWIGDKIDVVWISCDGYKEIQDYYRLTSNNTKSSEIVEINIKYLAKK
jgi:sulfatase maturation enzyme AslB (radical SAM superfamily)